MDNTTLKVIADAMLDKKGQDVVSLDLRPIGTAISDFFMVCNADSAPAVVAIADNVEEKMIEKCKRKVIRTQGKENAFWVIMYSRHHTGHSTDSRIFGQMQREQSTRTNTINYGRKEKRKQLSKKD